MTDEYSIDNLDRNGYYIVWSRKFDTPVGSKIWVSSPTVLFEIRCFRVRDGYHYASYSVPIGYPWQLEPDFKKIDKVKNMLNSGAYSAYDPRELCQTLLG